MLIAWHWTSWKWQKGWRPKADFKVLSRPKISLNNWKKKKTFEKRKNCQEDHILSWRFERIGEKWPLQEVLLYYLTVIIRRFSFNLEFIARVLFPKRSNCIRHTGSRSFDTLILKNTPAQMRLHSLCILQGVGGGAKDFFGGGLKIFLREKWGVVKNFWRQEEGMSIFLDSIERLISPLFSSSMKDAFIINALNCNVLYFVQ